MFQTRPEILLLEDDISLVQALTLSLSGEYSVISARDEDTGIQMLERYRFSLLLVDEWLSKGSGLKVIERAKSLYPDVPVFVITAQATKDLVIQCLHLGVKKFLEKPFELSELKKSLKAALGDQGPQNIAPGWKLYLEKQFLEFEGKSVPLTPIEFRIVNLLIEREGAIIPREELIQKIWGSVNISVNVLDTHLSSLRKKHEDLGRRIKVSRGRGFWWDSETV